MLLFAALALADQPATVGQPAPDFSVQTLAGDTLTLADFAGKTLVLEWFNPDCPYVVYAHGEEGPLRGLADKHAEAGVAWLAINSGTPGKQGTGAERNTAAKGEYAMNHAVALDEAGAIGQAYGATATPHMFVIDGSGTLQYAGALDNAPRGRLKGDAYVNYVDAALASVAAGSTPETPETKAYGCSVKY